MKLLLIALLAVILVSSTVLSHDLFAKSKDSKAKSAIIKAVGKAVEGKYSTIKLIQISKSNVTGYILAYNSTKAIPPVPPKPTPTPTPVPTPTPTGNVSKVCLVGDFKDGKVMDLMKKGKCDITISLGDSGYGSTLALLKSLGFTKCVIGNHDSTEDGSSAIYKEALAYCGDHWSLKIGNAAMIIGLNTNGDLSSSLAAVKSIISTGGNVQTVIVVSHKGGHVPPNSHHPAEAASLYKQLEALVPANVKLIEVVGHNHVSSSAPSMNWYQAGAGGKSFYSCGTDAIWTFCDNTHVGYLELTIGNKDGATAAKFIN